jgi:glycine betaine/proline transport system permease protein
VTVAQAPVGAPPERTWRQQLAALPTRWLLLAIAVFWFIGWVIMRGHDTLYLSTIDTNSLHNWLNDTSSSFQRTRESNAVLSAIFGSISDAVDKIVLTLQHLFSQPDFPRPVPQVGWLGVVAIATWVGFAVAGLRSAVLVLVSFLMFGFLGYWADSIDLLIVTLLAVAVALLIGIPLGVWMARSRHVTTVVTPVLDVMQTMPSYCYLLPLILLFGLGPTSAVVATLIFALPPVSRITAHGLRTVAAPTIEATRSMGSTGGQLLRKVQLPMAKRTIIVGVNQTMMTALSMATIAAVISGPGLGQPVVESLNTLDVGNASVAGLAIVIMAIMLDRTTTAASVRAELQARSGTHNEVARRVILIGGGVVALICVYVSHIYTWAAEFPEHPDLGTPIADWAQSVSDWVALHGYGFTNALKDDTSNWLINPLQNLLADSPWYLTAIVFVAISATLGGLSSAVITASCIVLLLGTGLWYDSMVTLTMTLVGTVIVMVLGVIFGVWMGRSLRVDVVLRPFLDAGQVIPPLVYLVPTIALFGATRFSAIVAAVIYAAPAAIKLVADGIRGVSPSTLEAAVAAGSNRWQIITQVQLPMARGSLLLAANQGLLYVLSMVVIGGLVGAGALGYLVVQGFTQIESYGKGLAAGAAIVLLGILLDRITQRAAGVQARQQLVRL